MPDSLRGAYRRRFHELTTWPKVILIAAVGAALATIPNVTRADECPTTPYLPSSDGSQPANLGVLKLQLLDYKCFGAYDRDVANVLRKRRLTSNIARTELRSLLWFWISTRHRFRIGRISWPVTSGSL